MIPRDQLVLSDPLRGITGDCWRACIASIIGYHPLDVPHFAELPHPMLATNEWLKKRGLDLYHCSPWKVPKDIRYVILGGGSPRGSIAHAVVGDLGETSTAERLKLKLNEIPIAHDPHPSRDGLNGVAYLYAIFPAESET